MRLQTALCLAFALACAEVDRDRYAALDSGVTHFRNPTATSLYLDGCTPFEFQRLRDDHTWSDPIPPFECIWQDFAREVGPGEVVASEFTAPGDPGTWRLRYDVGLGCAEQGTLDDCVAQRAAVTRPFHVVEPCPERACGPALGMPNWQCADGSFGGPTGRCLRNPETLACGWEIASCED
jgi:hypothetical protein